MLFCVCRGKYSEGYNFKDDLCRGLFLIGVPNLNIKNPKIQMKIKFYKNCKGLL